MACCISSLIHSWVLVCLFHRGKPSTAVFENITSAVQMANGKTMHFSGHMSYMYIQYNLQNILHILYALPVISSKKSMRLAYAFNHCHVGEILHYREYLAYTSN